MRDLVDPPSGDDEDLLHHVVEVGRAHAEPPGASPDELVVLLDEALEARARSVVHAPAHDRGALLSLSQAEGADDLLQRPHRRLEARLEGN